MKAYKRLRRRVYTLAESEKSSGNGFDWFGLFKPQTSKTDTPPKPQDDGKSDILKASG